MKSVSVPNSKMVDHTSRVRDTCFFSTSNGKLLPFSYDWRLQRPRNLSFGKCFVSRKKTFIFKLSRSFSPSQICRIPYYKKPAKNGINVNAKSRTYAAGQTKRSNHWIRHSTRRNRCAINWATARKRWRISMYRRPSYAYLSKNQR